MTSENFILNSDLNTLPNISVNSTVPVYILGKLREHEQNGRTTCITNPTTGEYFNYADISKISGNIACSLYKLGFRKGDTLIYCSHDGANLHLFFLGVWRANGILRSSYPEDNGDQLLERIFESNARWVLCDEAQVEACLNISKMLNHKVNIIVFGKVEGCLSASEFYKDVNDDEGIPNLELSPSDISLVLPTSGTTGGSKGAVFTHATIVRLLVLLEGIPLVKDPLSPLLLIGKQTHFSGSMLALSCMTAGKQLLMLSQVNIQNISDAIRNYKPTGLFLFPKYLMELAQLENLDLSSVQYLSTGGIVVGPSLFTAAKKFPNFQSLIILYGMTECGLLATNVNWSLNKNGRLIGTGIQCIPDFSCGKLPPESSLIVKDLETGEILGANEKGELYFKSKLICEEYLNRPRESAETIQGGWIRTGDLGYYDSNGFIFVVDRVKETFKYFNNHICPSGIEDIILRHPAVREACVIGVEDPNGGGSIPRAFVVLKQATLANDIMEYANSLLPTYKYLRGGLFILLKLPLGVTGKVKRRVLSSLNF